MKMEQNNLEYLTLNNGTKIPRAGLGCFNLTTTAITVYEAIKAGVRLLDTAYIYENEKEVGEGIAKALQEKLVERKDLYVITKIWINQYEDVEGSIKESLNKLQLDYVDLYLLHWPKREFKNNQITRLPTYKLWAHMEDLVKKGLTKSIGVSNFNAQLLLDMLTYCEIKPVINEIECHPYFQRKSLVDFCHKFGINVIAYNSLVLGRYAVRKDEIKDFNLLKESLVEDLAQKYNKSSGQIALNWAISQDIIVIPKSNSVDRIKSNTESSKFRLEKEDLALFEKLETGKRLCDDIDNLEKYGLYDNFA